MVATCSKLSVRNTLISLSPPIVIVTQANMPLALRTILTWLVIGPVSRVFKSANGGCPSNKLVLPVVLRVNQTRLLSGVVAVFGQNRLACGTPPAVLLSARGKRLVSGWK